jgi:hypothetical protein
VILSPSDLDILRNAAFVAAFLFSADGSRFNIGAGAVLCFSVLGKVSFEIAPTGFYACLAMAVLFSLNAGINIKLLSQIRQALVCIGFINWLGAVDFLLWPDRVTFIYQTYPYAINALDLFIIYHLFRPTHGGGKRANHYNSRFILGAWSGRSLLH